MAGSRDSQEFKCTRSQLLRVSRDDASARELVAEAEQVAGVPAGAAKMCGLRRGGGMQDLYALRFEELDEGDDEVFGG